jgi:alcohol dehydrogenase (NADP+)
MEALVDKGLVRSIGISNFSVKRLKELLAFARIPPAANQVEMHPYLPQDRLLAFCKGEGIRLTAYSPLGSPANHGDKATGTHPPLIEHPTITAVADRHGKTPAQMLLKWAMQRGVVPIPKSVAPSRLDENLAASLGHWVLSEQDLSEIALLATPPGVRYSAPPYMTGSGRVYFDSEADMWDSGDD